MAEKLSKDEVSFKVLETLDGEIIYTAVVAEDLTSLLCVYPMLMTQYMVTIQSSVAVTEHTKGKFSHTSTIRIFKNGLRTEEPMNSNHEYLLEYYKYFKNSAVNLINPQLNDFLSGLIFQEESKPESSVVTGGDPLSWWTWKGFPLKAMLESKNARTHPVRGNTTTH